MFTPRVMVLKRQKWLDTFCWNKSVPVWVRYLSASLRSYLSLSENTMDYVLLGNH